MNQPDGYIDETPQNPVYAIMDVLSMIAHISKNTLLAFVREHPYIAALVTVLGVILWPMSSSVVLGTILFLTTAAFSVILAVTILAPVLIALTFWGFSIWLTAVAALAGYRMIFQRDSSGAASRAKAARNKRWKSFASTLETDVRSIPVEEPAPLVQDVIVAVPYEAANEGVQYPQTAIYLQEVVSEVPVNQIMPEEIREAVVEPSHLNPETATATATETETAIEGEYKQEVIETYNGSHES